MQRFDRLAGSQDGVQNAIENGRISSAISDKGIGRIWGDVEHVIDGLHEGELRQPLDHTAQDAFNLLDHAERRATGLNYVLGTLSERFNRGYVFEQQLTGYSRRVS